MNARRLYRQLLREINGQLTFSTESPATLWREYVRKEFRRHARASEIEAASLLQQSQAYLDHLIARRTYDEMKEEYFPENKMGEQEMLKRTANQVGLEMPDFSVTPDSEEKTLEQAVQK